MGSETAKTRPALFLCAAVGLGLLGCPQKEAQPEDVLRDFLGNLRTGRADAAYAGLSAASRTELERRYRAFTEATNSKKPGKPVDMLYDQLGVSVLNKPDTEPRDLEDLMQNDQVLVAKMLAMVNSPCVP